MTDTPQPHLLAISLGPVQDFIAAGRKTRDLWAGSALLSELAKTAAVEVEHVVAGHGGALIFPAAKVLTAPDAGVANKLLALIPAGGDPADLADEACEAATQVLRDRLTEQRAILDQRTDVNWEDAVDWRLAFEQIEGFLEWYAAWVPLLSPQPPAAEYETARTDVERLLAGRKALRDFAPAAGRDDRPKSSLDWSRESVFTFDQLRAGPRERARIRLRAKGAEQLDALSLIKRLTDSRRRGAADPDENAPPIPARFVSVSRVTIDPYIRRVEAEETAGNPNATLATLNAQAEILAHGPSDLVERFTTNPGTGLEHYDAFPYDCQVFWTEQGRINADRTLSLDEREAAIAFCDEVDRLSGKNGLGLGEPPIYVAVLAADGDRMGKAISGLGDLAGHQRLSEALVDFAEQVGVIVRDHYGALVYSGGDDVLAFLPLDTAIPCANKLQEKFAAILGGVLTGTKVTEPPTLSVGIAIGHYSEHLQNLLQWARNAERAAKQHWVWGVDAENPEIRVKKYGNALAVHLHTRTAGAEMVDAVRRWPDTPDSESPLERWATWVRLHRAEAIPDGAAYELRDLERELRPMVQRFGKRAVEDDQNVPDERRTAEIRRRGEEQVSAILRAEVKRILERKQAKRGMEQMAKRDRERVEQAATDLDGLDAAVNELLIARRIAAVVELGGPTATALWPPPRDDVQPDGQHGVSAAAATTEAQP